SAWGKDLEDPPEIVVSGLAGDRVDDVPLTRDRCGRGGRLEEHEDRHGDVRLRAEVEVADGGIPEPAVDARYRARSGKTVHGPERRGSGRSSEDVAGSDPHKEEGDRDDREQDVRPAFPRRRTRRFHGFASRPPGQIAMSEFGPNWMQWSVFLPRPTKSFRRESRSRPDFDARSSAERGTWSRTSSSLGTRG